MGQQATRGIHRLTAIEVREAKADANDGGGLVLRVGADGRAAWVLRFTAPTGKRREMGLGVCHRQSAKHAGDSMMQVRKLATEAKARLDAGIDPLTERTERRAALQDKERQTKEEATVQRHVEHWTLARCARDYHERVVEPKLSAKHAAQWISSMENHMPASIWHAPIVTVTAPALVAALLSMKPHKRARQFGNADRLGETRSRVFQRLATVFDDAIFHGRAAANPAGSATRRKVQEAAQKRRRGSHRALAFAEAPSALRMLDEAEGVAARALQFAVFTAARTAEVIGATWAEIDAQAKVWRIPAHRMKSRRPHDVPLSSHALAVLERMRGLDSERVFPSSWDRDGKPQAMSNMAMLATLSRLGLRAKTTVHGLARATFSTWANERGIARPDVVEAALAHTQQDKTRAAYNRASFDEERRALLQAWGDFLVHPAATVVQLRAA